MRPALLFADGSAPAPQQPLADRVAEDLGLATVIDAMAAGDDFLAETARAVLLAASPGPEDVAYRQAVLGDLQREPELSRELYQLTGRALEAQRSAARTVYFDSPETVLNRSIVTLTAYVQLLRELRALADRYRPRVSSAGCHQFFAMVDDQFGEAYLEQATIRIDQLRLDGNLLVSARLGTGNQSEGLTMRQSQRPARSLFRRSGTPKATYKLPYGDEAASRALGSLRDQALAGLAGAADRSARHVLAFFDTLRTEVAFYLGCLNLREALTRRGAAVCVPAVHDSAAREFAFRGLYDPGLQLRLDQPATANDLDAGGRTLIMVTGANRGGKSTFLRSVGLAQLMAAAGGFVAAGAFTTAARSGVYTHFTTDEDDALVSGKFDEELRRMSQVADAIGPRGVLLCNESFQSTNEREGSDIARRIVDALTEAGVTVVFVTHLHELAQGCYDDRERFPATFLRAERERSFRLREAAPEATSHGADLWGQSRERMLARILADRPAS
ncbi:DNA mismatch repair protein MutS [Paractinoplanes abujensis]|uniref:DNA mismatch repair ATPase MutS n=1 Tax=Paractinoplanes abujensis TaxID=882441 RepID=A0A7W7CMR7_9ACTN|nr:DNA mismatch repair protein MutS [Actinoplanes abujensis]MBB4689975.1 DNA mismatch repair ATPase MutS [Actinoplanes abujensis]GID20748.1 DNA mismatch repair protein MutS [Actinoplanes abujensis]